MGVKQGKAISHEQRNKVPLIGDWLRYTAVSKDTGQHHLETGKM